MTGHDDNSYPRRKLGRRPLLWLSLGTALILLLIIGMISMHAAANSFHQPPSRGGQLAIITNSGSTNAPGSILTLNTDGSGSLVYQKDRGNSFRYVDKTFPARTFDLAQLENLLAQIGDVSTIPNHGCLKSISFGSTTTITYQGKTSGDVSCLSNTDQKIYLDVKERVETLYRQALKK
jgi:hypothetical protein